MATPADNPFDTQPPAAKPGIIGGVINSVANPSSQQTYTAQTREVNAPTDTAQGQLTSILASDSPLMQRARTLASQQMASRGLVNSSMNGEAGVAAMIDRAAPIAGADAAVYDARSKMNMDATNTAGMFNVGQNNQMLGQDKTIAAQMAQQKDAQTFTAGQSALDRTQQFNVLDRQQGFAAGESALDRAQQGSLLERQQTFQSAQSELDRALQVSQTDKSLAAQQALQVAQQNFAAAQADLDRSQQVGVLDKQQTFAAAQSELDRALQAAQADKSLAAQQALQVAQQNFAAAQADLDRSQQTTVLGAQQAFQSAQSELDRAMQVAQSDKSIAAQMALQTAQQNFSAAQADLDRVQQTTMADKQLESQQLLQKTQQEFSAVQNQLDREQQTALTQLQQTFSETNASKDFAANTASSTLANINTILSDPKLKPDAKRAAINNIIAAANSTMQWAGTFYQTELPPVKAPGA